MSNEHKREGKITHAQPTLLEAPAAALVLERSEVVRNATAELVVGELAARTRVQVRDQLGSLVRKRTAHGVHAQLLQRCQIVQGGREDAGQLVIIEVAAGTYERSLSRASQRCAATLCPRTGSSIL